MPLLHGEQLVLLDPSKLGFDRKDIAHHWNQVDDFRREGIPSDAVPINVATRLAFLRHRYRT
jgi:hypothetical protein